MLTVLLATYNHIAYLKKAIESVLNQKTNFDFQVYILDDASNDGTSNIVKAYARSYPNKIVPFIRDNNLGTIENLYQGIRSVKTKYFALLEGDDYWCDSNKLQKQIDALEMNPLCSFCGHDTRINNPNTCSATIASGKLVSSCFPKPRANIVDIGDRFSVHTSSRIFRTEHIDFSALKFKVSVVFDYCAYWYFISKGKLYYINDVMSEYNCSGKGWFSGLQPHQRTEMFLNAIIRIDEELGYKYSHILENDIKNCVTGSEFIKFKLRKSILGIKNAHRHILKNEVFSKNEVATTYSDAKTITDSDSNRSKNFDGN